MNADAFAAAMEPVLRSGRDVLAVAMSSGLSGTYNAAKIACEELAEKYPERKLFAVDTLAASLGEGMLVVLAAEKKRAGAGIEEVRDWL